MSEFQDVGQFHKNEQSGKWRFQKLGYAKPNKHGDGWDIYLDALPMPTSTGCRLVMQPQKQREQSQPSNDWPDRSGGDNLDQSIPF